MALPTCALLLFASCAQDPKSTPSGVAGSAQKGPMLLGSSVSVAATDNAGNPTGDVFSAETKDDLGTFALTVTYAGPITLTAEGFHFDELNGVLSTAPILLRAVAVLTSGGDQTLHINPITHLAAARTTALMASGSTRDDAVTQAEDELVTALGISPAGFDPAAPGTELHLLGGDTDGDAWLFAVGAVFLQTAWDTAGAGGPGDATLQELLNATASDLADDGAVDASRTTELRAASTRVDIDAITANLQARLDALGSTAVVPDMRRVLDHDLDGVVDANDTDADGDGYNHIASGGADCDDDDPALSPAADDPCGDGIDQDCSGTDDTCSLTGLVVASEVADVVLAEAVGSFEAASSLGDIDGDGIGDLAVVDQTADGDHAYVYAGAVGGPSNLPTGTISGLDEYNDLDAIAGIGDLDGDGFGDLIVGFPDDETTGIQGGAAYILSGPVTGTTLPSSARTTFFGAADDDAGNRVAGIGDIDGDALPDIAIAALRCNDAGEGAGAVYLLTDPPSGALGPADATATILGEGGGDYFGYGLAGAGDADGDGLGDVFTSAILENTLGAAYLFTGDLAGTVSAVDANLRVTGVYQEARAGSTLAFAGDANTDGLDDLVLRASQSEFDMSNLAVSLFWGTRSGDVTVEDADVRFHSDERSRYSAGASLGAGGDLDGDGNVDVVIAVHAWESDAGDPIGRAYIFYGPLAGSYDLADADAILEGDPDDADHLGNLVVAVGDVAGDGRDALLVTGDATAMLFLGAGP